MIKTNLHINSSQGLCLKDPQSTELGKKIVNKSIELIDELGFENFTFKKLGESIESNESSVYRYFSNKHILMVYLINWYWNWMEFYIINNLVSLNSVEEKLLKSIELVTSKITKDDSYSYIDEALLQKIIIVESSKVYHTKDIDDENKKGFYKSYKNVVQLIASFIESINPTYGYANRLISTVIEGAHHQRFFVEHLPTLANASEKDDIAHFYKSLVLKSIQS